ncbi:hypothetical protein Tco_0939213 [Tanacetum coccineum]|uniref:Uncharacterized protein n=1 Tax=Tanacetum coccineum TaxID=301880 RepID=A0ABQ5DL64_9ASTR
MATNAQNTNNTTIRSILLAKKLTSLNFTNWYRNLWIVLRYEKKIKFVEQPTGPPPDPETADPDTIDKYYETVNLKQEVECLMLGSMSSDLQRALENCKAYDMIQELKTMFEEQAKQELFEQTKLSILIMQFAKHKIYRGKPSLSNLYNCTRFFINEDIPEIINFKKSVVAIVGTETPEHPIAPLVTYKKISVRDEFLTHLEKVNLAYIRDIRKVMSCVIVGTIKCVERETKWYYLGCRACNFGVDPKTEEYKDEESGLVKKKTVGYIFDITDYNLSKNKYVYGVSQICQEADVIEELELKVPTLEATVSSSLTPSLGFISPPSRLKYQDSASETGDTSSLIESLKDTGTSPIKRKLEDVIDVEELSNASSTKKKPLAPKIEKD